MRTIEIGTAPDDGTGDTVREAFEKVNGNFRDLVESQWRQASGTAADAGLLPTDFVPRHLSDRPPNEPPPMYGAIWIVAGEGRVFIATGTESVDDWRELAFKAPGE